MMIIDRNREGQTLIETALVLFLILLILLGITEFSRAWYTKNSIKNAVRQGVRVAVVTPSLVDVAATQCPNANIVITAVCTAPGVKNNNRTRVTIDVEGKNGTPAANGDTILVRADYNDPTFFILGNRPWPWPKALNTTEEARMRYE